MQPNRLRAGQRPPDLIEAARRASAAEHPAIGVVDGSVPPARRQHHPPHVSFSHQ